MWAHLLHFSCRACLIAFRPLVFSAVCGPETWLRGDASCWGSDLRSGCVPQIHRNREPPEVFVAFLKGCGSFRDDGAVIHSKPFISRVWDRPSRVVNRAHSISIATEQNNNSYSIWWITYQTNQSRLWRRTDWLPESSVPTQVVGGLSVATAELNSSVSSKIPKVKWEPWNWLQYGTVDRQISNVIKLLK